MVGTNPKFDALLTHMKWLHSKKNYDYAADTNPFSNFEEAAQYAGVSVDQVFKVLMGIKKARLDELTKAGKTPNNESILDTYIDYTMYSALRTAYMLPIEYSTQIGGMCKGGGD